MLPERGQGPHPPGAQRAAVRPGGGGGPVTPEERELRRALEARSGEPTPAFRARLSAALAENRRPAARARQAIALVAATLLAVATVAVLLLAGRGPGMVPAGPVHLLPYVRH